MNDLIGWVFIIFIGWCCFTVYNYFDLGRRGSAGSNGDGGGGDGGGGCGGGGCGGG
tara:strand:- start:353 stop:520 length:168 start_codon:yes stop_codon:yes gene_type:complete